MNRWIRWLAGGAIVAVAVADVGSGRPTEIKLAPEVRVSVVGRNPALAVYPGGRVLLVWEEDLAIRADHVLGDEPQGSFVVSPAGGAHLEPSVAIDRRGNSIVAWTAIEGSQTDVLAQRFRRSGARRGAIFRANKSQPGEQHRPLAAFAPDGRFAIAWEDSSSVPDSIAVARYGAGGQRLSNPVSLPVELSSSFENPDVPLGGLAATENFILGGWTETSSCESDGDEVRAALARLAWEEPPDIAVRRFKDPATCAGGPVLAGLLVGGPDGPAAVFAGHNFSIARLSPETGEPSGPRIVIAEAHPCDAESCQTLAAVAGSIGNDGRFAVIWEDRTTVADEDSIRLFAQLFGRDGRARSDRVELGSEPSATPHEPAAALLQNRTLVVAFVRGGEDLAAPGLFLQSVRFP